MSYIAHVYFIIPYNIIQTISGGGLRRITYTVDVVDKDAFLCFITCISPCLARLAAAATLYNIIILLLVTYN